MKHQLQPYKLLWGIAVSSNSLKTLPQGTKKYICSLWHFIIWLPLNSQLRTWLFLMVIAVAAILVKYLAVVLRYVT